MAVIMQFQLFKSTYACLRTENIVIQKQLYCHMLSQYSLSSFLKAPSSGHLFVMRLQPGDRLY